jgi:hypothetical protein
MANSNVARAAEECVSITLTSYDVGDLSRADYDDWVTYVSRRLDDVDDVVVDADRFGTSGGDRYHGGTSERREELAELIQDLWAEWCDTGAGGGEYVDTLVTVRGVRLVRRDRRGPRGGRVSVWQSSAASRDWGYWYDTASQAASSSNESDRVGRL